MTRKFHRLFSAGAAVLAAALMMGTLSACYAPDDKPGQEGSDVSDITDASATHDPLAESLLDSSPAQSRYMTLPDSRVVVNPYEYDNQPGNVTEAAYSNRDSMPLNFGFCDPYMWEGRGTELADALMLASGAANASGTVETLWEGNMEGREGWAFSGVEGVDYTVAFGAGTASLTVTDTAPVYWQHMEAPVFLNVDDAQLIVTVADASSWFDGYGSFAIKVTDNPSQTDITLVETSRPGTYVFDLQQFTGWSGEKTIWVKIFAVGNGSTVTISDARILKGSGAYDSAADYATSWRPDQLGFTASYPNGVQVTGTDFFYDEKTVVRDMVVTGDGSLLLYGRFSGAASVDGSTVVVENGSLRYAVTLSEEVQPVFYANTMEALAGGEGVADPATAPVKVWAYRLNTLPEGGRVRVSFAFDTRDAAAADVVALSRAPGEDCADRLAARTAQWDDLLSRVPRPGTYELDGIDTKGVTADDVKQAYYKAWVQIIGSVLPTSPETGYNYRSFATGKASLWGYGHPKNQYSATWEGFYGIAYYAQIDAEQAWEMMTGFLSLVDETGEIMGESLPANQARAVWMLYAAQPDKEALAAVQPALTRHLQWCFDNPRWIYLDYTPVDDQKDIEFVASALIDTGYLMRINEELGLENDALETLAARQYANMQAWFFSGGYPMQYYYPGYGMQDYGNPLWITKALHVPGLQSAEEEALMRVFRDHYFADVPFCGIGGTKYESYLYTVLGLLEHGYEEEGRTMIQTAVRDVVRAGMFASEYDQADINGELAPQPHMAVRPSLSGAALLIDSVYLMNGVRLDDGAPVFVDCFGQDGGLDNLTVNGSAFYIQKRDGAFTYGAGYPEEGEQTLETEADSTGDPVESDQASAQQEETAA